jgi:hypothetical protein
MMKRFLKWWNGAKLETAFSSIKAIVFEGYVQGRKDAEADNKLIRDKAIAVLEWYHRDGSVGGACDPMEELQQALGVTDEWLNRK